MTNASGVESSQVIDVAIIGGGVSGAYAGWRLVKSKKNMRVGLYEMSDRIGGRLLSVSMPDMPHVYAEFGGMAFSESQAIVSELAKQLSLKVVPFPFGDLDNLLYVRGQHLRLKDLVDSSKVPYNLRFNERGLYSDQLFELAVQSVLPNQAKLPPGYFSSDEWKEVRETLKVEGKHLYDLSIWELLLKVLSNEAYTLALDTGFYYSNVSNWNAAEAIAVNISTPYQQQWNTIADGYEQLPKTLVAEFEQQGGQVLFSHRLSEFERRRSDGLIELKFVDVETQQAYPKVLAKHLILAMPRRSIELIQQRNKDNFVFKNSEFLKNIRTVIGNPVFKLFLGYEYPWWRNVGVETGSSMTDLPMRRCFYFGTEGEQDGGDPKNLRSLMMANFPDGRAARFWQPMEHDPSESEQQVVFKANSQVAPLQRSFLKGDGSPQFEPLKASRNMVDTAQQQLKELHGLGYIPEPYTALYLDWTKDPYGGGWHSWKPYCKPWEVIPQMRRPVKDINVYVCGDCYSNYQGWVQGALNSAELMLEENFQLDRPDWLPSWYDLGP